MDINTIVSVGLGLSGAILMAIIAYFVTITQFKERINHIECVLSENKEFKLEFLKEYKQEIDLLKMSDSKHAEMLNCNQNQIIVKITEIFGEIALIRRDMEYLKEK